MVDYPLTGGITGTASLGGYFERKGVIAPVSVGGAPTATVVISGGTTPAATFGGTSRWIHQQLGGITVTAQLGGSLRTTWQNELTSTPSLGGTLLYVPGIRGGVEAPAWVVATKFLIAAVVNGGVVPTATVGATWGRKLTGGITSVASLGGSSYNRAITPTALLGGGFSVARLESISLDNDYYQTHERPIVPLVVYSLNAFTLSQVQSLNSGAAFLVTPDYDGQPGDSFYDAGARANYVGYYKRQGEAADVVFRKPDDWEVVYFYDTGKLYRYSLNRETGVRAWAQYRSMPQRALDGMQAFNAFDPDRIYDYVATIIGGYLAQLQADARVARSVRNPDLVPRLYIPAAMENIAATGGESYTIDADASTEQSQRHMLATAPTMNKYAGARQAVVGRLKALGFIGDVTTTWLKVTWPSILVSAPAVGAEYNLPASGTNVVVYGFSGGSPTRVAQALITIPPQRENANPGDVVLLTRLDSPNVVEKFTFMSEKEVRGRVSMGGGFKKVSTGAVVQSTDAFDPHETLAIVHPTALESLDSLRRAIDAHGYFVVESTTGIPGPASVDVPWDYKDSNLLEAPVAYWPSKFVTIHLNNLDGTRYRQTDLTARNRVRDIITASLSSDVLPVHARISQWATDSPVAGSTIEVTESFSFTQV